MSSRINFEIKSMSCMYYINLNHKQKRIFMYVYWTKIAIKKFLKSSRSGLHQVTDLFQRAFGLSLNKKSTFACATIANLFFPFNIRRPTMG